MSKLEAASLAAVPPSYPEVSIAYLQAPATCTALGIQSLTELGKNKTPSVRIELRPGGLMLSKGSQQAWVPDTNVKIAILK